MKRLEAEGIARMLGGDVDTGTVVAILKTGAVEEELVAALRR
jgi:hypothetical protein